MLHPSLSQSNRRRSRYQQNVPLSLMHRRVLIHRQHPWQHLEEIRGIENPSNYIISCKPAQLATRKLLKPGEPASKLGAASQNQSTVTAADIRAESESQPSEHHCWSMKKASMRMPVCNLHNLVDPKKTGSQRITFRLTLQGLA